MEAAEVVSVLRKVDHNEASWGPLVEEAKALLSNSAPSLFIHGAAVLDTPPEFMAQLGLEPQLIATYANTLVADSGVQRRQYQRVIGEHTRVQTFDMIGECPEGYGRLLRLLAADEPSAVIWERALDLIGEFTLEPFKVLSLYVAVLLDHPDRFDDFAKVISSSLWANHADWAAVFNLVGQWGNSAPLIAAMIVHGAVRFEDVYASLDPGANAWSVHEQSVTSVGVESGTNALSMAMPLIDDDEEDDKEAAKDRLKDNMPLGSEESMSSGDGDAKLLDSAFTPSAETKIERCFELFGCMFEKLATQAQEQLETSLFSVMADHPVAFGASEVVGRGLSRLVAAKLETSSPEGLASMLIPHAIYEPAWSALSDLADLDFFRKYMLPSLDLHPETQPVLWDLPAVERYALYTEFCTRIASSNTVVKARFTRAEKDTKDVLKRLTKQDAEQIIVPQLLEIFARCPWPSLNVFVNQVENYNIGQLVAHASHKIAPLAMDMLPLILMQQFTAAGRETKQRDGLFDQKWFRQLAQFAGDVAVAYESFDFVSLIKLVLQQFAEDDFQHIVVLEQLFSRLGGFPDESNLSIPQLSALNTAPPLSDLVAAAISEQYFPQRQRLSDGLKEADLTTTVFVALNYAYVKTITTGSDAKIAATTLDRLTKLILTYTNLVNEPLDRRTLVEAGTRTEFVNAAVRHRTGPIEFWNLCLFDLNLDQTIYGNFMSISDAKAVERASLSHRLRVKSVQQQLSSASKPSTPDLIARVVLSPSDALYASKFVQVAMHDVIDQIFTRGVVLSILRSCTPFETESFACFLQDVFRYLYFEESPSLGVIRNCHAGVTSAILEAAFPSAAYSQLANCFALMQRSLTVYPLFENDGMRLLGRIRLLTAQTSADLETAVRSLSPQLSKRASTWQAESIDSIPKEFLSELKQEDERLTKRLVASVQLVPTMEETSNKSTSSYSDSRNRRPRSSKRKRFP